MTKKQEARERIAINEQIVAMEADPTKGIPKPLFSTPNCQYILKDKSLEYQDDFNKNYQDKRSERPGICFLEGLDTAPKNANTANLDNAHPSKGLYALQTPINLETNTDIIYDFQDEAFKFNYEKVNAKNSLKFNEQGDAFYYQLNDKYANKDQGESYFETNTISLFDNHIEKARLNGL